MGQQQSSQKQKQSYLQQWQTLDHLQNFNLVRNTRTHQLGQTRRYKLDSLYDPQDELRIYEMRNIGDQPIVRTYSAEVLEKVSRKLGRDGSNGGTGICASNNHIGVVTQSIPFTLNDLPQLSFPESLYVLRQSLKGYEHLYPRTGPVHITPKMIGMNPGGKVKVWINEDFSQNHPNSQIRSLLSTRNKHLDREYNLISPQFRDEKEMVENIIDVVEDRNQIGIFNSEFHNGIRENCQSFKTALQYLDTYVNAHRIALPSHIQEKYVQLDTKAGINAREGFEAVKGQIMREGAMRDGQGEAIGNMPIGYIDRTYDNRMGVQNAVGGNHANFHINNRPTQQSPISMPLSLQPQQAPLYPMGPSTNLHFQPPPQQVPSFQPYQPYQPPQTQGQTKLPIKVNFNK